MSISSTLCSLVISAPLFAGDVGDAPVPAKNEVAMSPDQKITAETSVGKIAVTAGKGLKRSYAWEDATRSVEMWPSSPLTYSA
jgi:hypothetical protein